MALKKGDKFVLELGEERTETHECDCISRQAAIDTVFKFLGKREIARTIQTALWILPSVEPEIIRCKDCKYWREHKYAKYSKRYIPFCGFNAIYTEADDFCSMAERRTDGQTVSE